MMYSIPLSFFSFLLFSSILFYSLCPFIINIIAVLYHFASVCSAFNPHKRYLFWCIYTRSQQYLSSTHSHLENKQARRKLLLNLKQQQQQKNTFFSCALLLSAINFSIVPHPISFPHHSPIKKRSEVAKHAYTHTHWKRYGSSLSSLPPLWWTVAEESVNWEKTRERRDIRNNNNILFFFFSLSLVSAAGLSFKPFVDHYLSPSTLCIPSCFTISSKISHVICAFFFGLFVCLFALLCALLTLHPPILASTRTGSPYHRDIFFFPPFFFLPAHQATERRRGNTHPPPFYDHLIHLSFFLFVSKEREKPLNYYRYTLYTLYTLRISHRSLREQTHNNNRKQPMDDLSMEFCVSNALNETSMRSEEESLYFEAPSHMGSPSPAACAALAPQDTGVAPGATSKTVVAAAAAENSFFMTPQKQRPASPSSLHHPHHPRSAQPASSPNSPGSRGDDGSFTPSQRLLFLNSPATTTQPQTLPPAGAAPSQHQFLCLGSPSGDDRGFSLNGESPSGSRQTSAAPHSWHHRPGGMEVTALEELVQRLVPAEQRSSAELDEDRRGSPSPAPLTPTRDIEFVLRRGASLGGPEAASRTVSPSPAFPAMRREAAAPLTSNFFLPQRQAAAPLGADGGVTFTTAAPPLRPGSTPADSRNAIASAAADDAEVDMWQQHAAFIDSDEEADREACGRRLPPPPLQQARSPPPPTAAFQPAFLYPSPGAALTPLDKEEQDRLDLEAFQRSHLGAMGAYEDDNAAASRFHSQQAACLSAMKAAVAANMAAKGGMTPEDFGWAPVSSSGQLFPADLFSPPALAQQLQGSLEEEQQALLQQLQAAALHHHTHTQAFPPPYAAAAASSSAAGQRAVETSPVNRSPLPPATIFSTSPSPHNNSYTDPFPATQADAVAGRQKNPAAMTTADLLQQYSSAHQHPSSGTSPMQYTRHPSLGLLRGSASATSNVSPLSSPSAHPRHRPSPGQSHQGQGGTSRGNSPLSSLSSVSQGLPPPPTANRSSYHAKLKAAAGSLIAVGGRRVPVDKLHHLLNNSPTEEGEDGEGGEENDMPPQGPSSRRAPGKTVRIVKVSASPSNNSYAGSSASREGSAFRPSLSTHRESSTTATSMPSSHSGSAMKGGSGSALPPPPTYLKHTFGPSARPGQSQSPSQRGAGSSYAEESSPSAVSSPQDSGSDMHHTGPIVVLRFTRGEVMNFRVSRGPMGPGQQQQQQQKSAPLRCEVGKSYLAYIRGVCNPYGSFGYCDVGCCIQVVAPSKISHQDANIHGSVMRRVDTALNPEEGVHQSELRHAEATVFQETLNRIQLLNLPVQLECVHITHDKKICVLYIHHLTTSPSHSGALRRNKDGATKALQKDIQRFVKYTARREQHERGTGERDGDPNKAQEPRGPPHVKLRLRGDNGTPVILFLWRLVYSFIIIIIIIFLIHTIKKEFIIIICICVETIGTAAPSYTHAKYKYLQRYIANYISTISPSYQGVWGLTARERKDILTTKKINNNKNKIKRTSNKNNTRNILINKINNKTDTHTYSNNKNVFIVRASQLMCASLLLYGDEDVSDVNGELPNNYFRRVCCVVWRRTAPLGTDISEAFTVTFGLGIDSLCRVTQRSVQRHTTPTRACAGSRNGSSDEVKRNGEKNKIIIYRISGLYGRELIIIIIIIIITIIITIILLLTMPFSSARVSLFFNLFFVFCAVCLFLFCIAFFYFTQYFFRTTASAIPLSAFSLHLHMLYERNEKENQRMAWAKKEAPLPPRIRISLSLTNITLYYEKVVHFAHSQSGNVVGRNLLSNSLFIIYSFIASESSKTTYMFPRLRLRPSGIKTGKEKEKLIKKVCPSVWKKEEMSPIVSSPIFFKEDIIVVIFFRSPRVIATSTMIGDEEWRFFMKGLHQNSQVYKASQASAGAKELDARMSIRAWNAISRYDG
eukprot:gene5888-4205_t